LLAFGVALVASHAAARVSWCIGAGAPTRGEPLVDHDGRVFVTTTDGYVHSFEPDGRFRWSYTVSGAVMGTPVIRPSDGALLVGTSDRWLYAVMDDGLLGFAYPTLVPVMSGLVDGPEGAVLFGGGDGYLYAFSPGGTARWRAPLGGILTGDPLVGRRGTVWVAAGRELLRLDKAWRAHRSTLPFDAVGSPVGFGDGVAVVAGSELIAFDAEGRGRFSKPHVAFVAENGSGLVSVSPEGRVELLDARGKTALLANLAGEPSEAPLSAGGFVYVPLMNGSLARIGGAEPRVELLQVARGALGRPILDAVRHQLIVRVAGAQICAVGLPG
jgi:outer membrane protein assembly factor BamB